MIAILSAARRMVPGDDGGCFIEQRLFDFNVGWSRPLCAGRRVRPIRIDAIEFHALRQQCNDNGDDLRPASDECAPQRGI